MGGNELLEISNTVNRQFTCSHCIESTPSWFVEQHNNLICKSKLGKSTSGLRTIRPCAFYAPSILEMIGLKNEATWNYGKVGSSWNHGGLATINSAEDSGLSIQMQIQIFSQ